MRKGAILDDLGLDDAMQALVDAVVAPLAAAAFPEWCGPKDCVGHYGFAVRYNAAEAGGDVALAAHTDTSNATLNVCLGRDSFEGGALAFGGLRYTESEDR